MRTNAKKRFLAWTLAFLMVFTYVPATAYATDTVDAAPAETAAVEDVAPATETAPAAETSEEPAVVDVEADVVVAEEAAAEETSTETEEPATGTEEEISVLDGQILIHNDKANGLLKNGTVTVTATGAALQKVTNTVTITNKSGKKVMLTFDYLADNYNAFSEANANGSIDGKVLDAGESISMYITSKTSGTATLTLSNFVLEDVADSADMTFTFDDKMGSITVAGEKVASGTKKTTTYAEGLALTAEPAAGAEFLGWINAETGRIFSTEAEFNLKPTKSAEVEAVFVNDKSGSYYMAGTTFIFTDLDKATAKAAALDKRVVTLLNDVTLAKGDHVIPAGVTLLVPFDKDNTLYTTNPKGVHGSYQTPKAYRTLTLEDGANLIVNGAVSLSANHNAANGGAQASGAPTGNVSFMDMEKGSTVTVKDGGALYAYGFIVGEGAVKVESGAVVYENFQIEDFRGGTVTSNMATNNKGVLPIAQYYVQNIEVPMTLEAGATEFCYTSLYISSMVFGSAVKFISNENAMFNLEEGFVTKSYDGKKDRLVVEGNGDMSLSPITVELEGQKINSKAFELPINGNITVKVNTGDVEINQDIALLPGSEIEIAEGATCTLGKGVNVYTYDADQWGTYLGSANAKILPVTYAPGKEYNRTEKDLVDASIIVNGKLDAADGFLYTTTDAKMEKGHANIYSTGNGVIDIQSGTQEYTYQTIQDGYNSEYVEIYLLPANLVNGDGSHVQTLETGVGTYTYANGTWACSHEVKEEKVTKEATCTEDGLKTVTCKCEIPHTYIATIPAAHDLTAVDRKEPTCTEDGYTAGGQCSKCDYVENKEELPALGHTEEAVKDVKPTCTETGLEGKVICSVCKTVLNEGTVIKALGHDWDGGYVSVKPTVEKEGQKVLTCNECGETKTEVIEKLEERTISDYETFIEMATILEDLAYEYTFTDKGIGKDPANLFIKYIRTGVDRYNSGSWQIMAGYEDAGFADYVAKWEADYNAANEEKIYVTALKNLENFNLPSGDYVDIGHMFGTMDISYTNIDSVNHADVSGWAGDTTDLLSTADYYGDKGELEDCVDKIYRNYLCKSLDKEDIFSSTDMLGDLDGFYVIQQLKNNDYEKGFIAKTMKAYFNEELSEETRAKFFLENRLNCGTTREAVREAVYNAYTSNSVIATLEGTREFQSDEATLDTLRRACCYAFADYICRLAGDFVDVTDNPYYEVYSAKYSNLAPGISQEIKSAKTADNKEMMYYVATADITRDDVNVYANYASRPVDVLGTDENGKPKYDWQMTRVLDQAQKAQNKFGDPTSKDYIENYNVITAINADGFNMQTGEPGGLLVMDGKEYHGVDGGGFFGIMKDGTAVLGTQDEYNTIYKDKVAEGVGGFGTLLVKEGQIAQTPSSDYYANRASRTAVGITKTGKVVFLVVDGRQNSSVGGSMEEIAQIMLEAGCWSAINLDGGGSTTYVGRPEGTDGLDVINVPSDGIQRSVSTTLMMVSTAPSSTAFDHAVLETATNYMSKGSEMQVTAKGVSATGNSTDLPENTTWAVSNDKATISKDGVLTAVSNGTVDVQLKDGDKIVGKKTITIVVPDKVTFSKSSVNVVYGSSVTLPVKAYYEGKLVTVNPGDFDFVIGNAAAGTIKGFEFTAAEGTGIRNTNVTLTVKGTAASGTIAVRLYNQGEATFDFDKATGGTREFAWDRQVSNAFPGENNGYYVDDEKKAMTTTYTFAIDMTQIPIPEKLADLTYMLPGSDLPDACAWTFLCNLAGRISDLTQVTAVIDFDDNVDIDYKDVKIVTDYFKLNKEATTFDAETNTLTLKMNWVRQFAAIDYEMANPICIVTGLKITPKADAKWDENKTLQITNKGTISYEAYMKASSLYTFANNPANQQRYDLYPYENDYIMINGDQDKGGKFGATYCYYSDTYSLINSTKKGWIGENGGQAYYKDGQKLTGLQLINGFYYDFGEEGWIKSRDDKYSGFITNKDKTYSYARDGVLVGGWVQVEDDYYYFAHDTKKNLSGKHTLEVTTQTQLNINSGTGKPKEYLVITEDIEYEFDAKGKVTPRWYTDPDDGKTYYYVGPQCLCWKQGIEIDGKIYYIARSGMVYKGLVGIQVVKADPAQYYILDKQTGEFIQKCLGFVQYNGLTYYFPDPLTEIKKDKDGNSVYTADQLYNGRLKGFHQLDGKYYLFGEKGAMKFGKQDISAFNPDGCPTLTFDKAAGGYAVDVNGEAVTSLTHNYVKAYIAPTATTKGGWALQCENCGDISKWTKVQTYKQYVNATTIKGSSKAAIKDETITLTWKANSEAKMTRYDVYRSKTGKAGSYAKVATVKTAKYVDKKATPGTKYYYKVQGVSVVKNVGYKTKFSNVMSNKVPKATAKFVKNSKVKGVKAAFIAKGVKLTWEAPRFKAKGYEIWRATAKNGKYTKVKTVTGLQCKDTKNTKVGKVYWYKVRAYKMVNGKKVYSAYSAKVSKKVLNKQNANIYNSVNGIDGITNVKAAAVDGGIKVTWSKKAAVKANQYEIWRAVKGGKYVKVATVNKAASVNKNITFTDKKAAKGKTYNYKVIGKRTVAGVTAKTKASAVVSAVR